MSYQRPLSEPLYVVVALKRDNTVDCSGSQV